VVDPSSEAFRIHGAWIGAGGRTAYLNVHAGPRYERRGGPSAASGGTGTPLEPWIVDLETGTARVAGPFEGAWVGLPGAAPEDTSWTQPLLYVARVLSDGSAYVVYDATTGAPLRTLPWNVEPDDLRAWRREEHAAQALHRDGKGRAVWLEGGEIVREGAPGALPAAGPAVWRDVQVIPGGWCIWSLAPGAQRSRFETLELETGRRRAVPEPGRGGPERTVLTPRFVLHTRASGSRRRWVLERAVLLDLDDPGQERTVELPEEFKPVGGPRQGGRLLGLIRAARPLARLVFWSPLTGAIEPVLDEEGAPVRAPWAGPVRVGPGERLVVRAREPNGRGPSWLLVEGPDRRARRLPLDDEAANFVFERDGAILAVEAGRRLVRCRADGSREVLFPRRPDASSAGG
jgi:hypothetical protein